MARRILVLLAAVLVSSVGLVPVAALPDPPPADVSATATLAKEASESEVVPGETFTYTLTLGCSSITDNGCRGAVLGDVVPAPFEVVGATVGGGVNTADDPVIDGNSVTVTWTTDLGDGTTGILDNSTGVVEIEVVLPEDVSADVSGVPVVNDALLEGTNFVDVDDQVEVTPVVPVELATTATKAFDPDSSLATPGTPVRAALTATNDSNATVETLTIQDPVDPDAAPNPFDYLAFTDFGFVVPPDGTSGTTYEVYVDGAWVEAPGGQLPGGVDPGDVAGMRITFTGDIPAGASVSVDLELETTELAAEQPDGFVVTNTVQSQVTLGEDDATGEASDDFTLLANDIQVGAAKTFDPGLVVAGESSTATLGASNDSGIALDSLTIREPSTGEFPAEYTFGGIDAGIGYPAGATSGVAVYHLADGSTQEQPFADGETPAPPDGALADVVSFEVVFTGDIQPGGETEVAFTVGTDPDAEGLPVAVPNEIAVVGENEGESAEAMAQDDLYVYDEVIEPYIDKTIRPSQILAVPGESVTVSLEGGLTERPNPPDTPDGSTGAADQIVLQDPQDPVEPDDWWNAFDVTAITQTPIPADSTLTVEYYDTTDDTWKTLTGPIAGPAIHSEQVPAGIRDVAGGVRFVYDYTGDADGFPPGTDLAPNFTSVLRPDGRYEAGPPFDDEDSTFVPNCAQSGATSPTPGVSDGEASMPADECPEVELIPIDPEDADLVDKEYGTSSSGGDKSVIARSGDTIPATLSWSTGGFSNLERVELTDIADPEGTAVEDSVFDAFNLDRVQPITPATDPLIAFDQVQQVLLWNGSDWVDAANDPCPAGCIGRFPGMDLTAAERQSTLGVRLVFVESPDRDEASEGNLDAPPVGSGVARSFGNTRPVQVIWEVRDEKRSDGAAVLADEVYNLTDPGVVRNTVNATGYPADGSDPLSHDDQDDVVIVDVPLTTTTDKNWSGGPLSVPEDPDVAPSQFPRSRVTVTTRNTTPARVDQLVITDTAPGSVTDRRQDPFQAFSFDSFVMLDEPAGTQSTVVTLFCPDGSAPTYTRDEALALTAADLPCDVSGVQVAFDGRIQAAAAGVLVMDVRLRPFWRDTDERVSPADSPIGNTAEGVVADVDDITDCPPPDDARVACDQGSATIVLEEAGFGVTAGKTISPAQQKDGDFSPVTVTLSGRNSGATRAVSETITDDDPTFWNAVDFIGMDPSWTLPTPIGRVTACYLDGGTFTDENVENDTVGGDLTCGPNGGTLAEAMTFLEGAPDTLHGLSFEFVQEDGLPWRNPTDPLIEVPFLVERRTDLRTGDPVPTTRDDQVAAPGEEDAGIFWNTVDVHAESADINPGQNLTADDTADAEYRHLHLEAAVSVAKGPTGDQRPGTVIPFTLAFTNTGEAPLHDPVFTDELPTDDQGRQLIFDPDRDPSRSPYTFALEGEAPDPANGLPLPTDEESMQIEEVGDTIEFRMPEGSVLEPGQTYTITIELMLRPGLTPNDDVVNGAVIEVVEPFDECVPTLVPETGACMDDTVVSPLAVPALSTVKYVKADELHGEDDIPEVLSTADDFSCDDAADADGFYRSPCVPVTLPGGTETWRFTITNSGTLPMDHVVSIDNLPVPGDQGLIDTTPRGSEWPPTFVGDVELVNPPAGVTLSTYYSTQSVPCTADLNPLGTPCAAGAWEPYDDSVDPADVASLKFQLDFSDDLFVPGEHLTLQFRTLTSPDAAVETDYPIAWNTVSTGGSAIADEAAITVPATEGRRVGVAYPTGPLQLEKIVSGPGAANAPDEFPVQVTCAYGDAAPVELTEVVLEPGADPTQVDGLPWGTECTATEGQYGQAESIIGTAVVGGPDDEIGLITVENVYEVGGLRITKAVDGAVDQGGEPVSYGPFEVTVTCEFLGAPAFAEGYGPDTPMVGEIAGGETWVLTGLPTGAECVVEETDGAGATETTVTPSDVVIGPDSSGTVAIVNAFDTGSLALEKVVTGAGAEFGTGPFTLHVTCVLDDESGERTVYDGDVVLGGDEALSTQIDGLAANAECAVTEPDAGGAHDTVIEPSTVTVSAEETASVTVTNTFDAGALTVTKEVEGSGAELYGAGPFEVTVTCTREGAGGPVELPVPGGAARELSAGNDYTATYEPLLLGAECQVEETGTGGATETAVLDENGDPLTSVTIDDAETPVAVRVVNTFGLGSIEVTKTITGDGADDAQDAEFAVALECVHDVDGTATPVEIPGGAERTLSAADGLTTEYADLPVGAECTLTEPGAGGADATTITPNDGDPAVGVVVVEDGATVGIEVENSFGPTPTPTPTEPGPDEPTPGGPGPDMPDTGGPAGLGYLALSAFLLIVLGGAAAVAGRRRLRGAHGR